ncbi:MAG: hypothetical protein IK070_00945, partial [Clostridia bacterium]|nr:hypothetical protein [Clostridia bacterium]
GTGANIINNTVSNNPCIAAKTSGTTITYAGGVVGNTAGNNTITGNTVKMEIRVSIDDTNTKGNTLYLKNVEISVSFTKNMSASCKFNCNISQNTSKVWDRNVDLTTNEKITTWLSGKNIHYIAGNLGDSTSYIYSNTINSSSKIQVKDTYYKFEAELTDSSASTTEGRPDDADTYYVLYAQIKLTRYKYNYTRISSTYTDSSSPSTNSSWRGWSCSAWNYGSYEACVDSCVSNLTTCFRDETTYF